MYTRLLPRILVDVTNVDTKTTVLGAPVSSPICIAPTAMQQMAHPDGEAATARAAARNNTLMTLSTLSTLSIEEVAAANGHGAHRWGQLYVYKDRAVTLNLIKRFERAGYKALAITVDTPILGRREADIKNKFSLPSHLTMGNFKNVGGSHASGTKSAGDKGSGLASYVSKLIDQSLTWADIAWVRKQTNMKIVVKGVMSVADAIASVKHGVDGIWVSNHGARQLDTTPATIEVLGDICKAVGGKVEVYIDGGIVRGTDVFKALALGARAVFIGRPVLWGLVHSGEEGVNHVLKLLNDEFVLAMKLAGVTKLDQIKPSFVKHALGFQMSKI
jgi:(S)-2-hydroxy-acid oxidase